MEKVKRGAHVDGSLAMDTEHGDLDRRTETLGNGLRMPSTWHRDKQEYIW